MAAESGKRGRMMLRKSSKSLFGQRFKWEEHWFEVVDSTLIFRVNEGGDVIETIDLKPKTESPVTVEIEGPEKNVVTITQNNRTYRCQCKGTEEAKEWLKAIRDARDNKKSVPPRRMIIEVCVFNSLSPT